MGRRLQTVAAVTFLKTLLMIFNLVFWLTGIAILAVGIWTTTSVREFMELSSTDYNNASYILIGTGAAIIIVGSLACCCTIKGSSFFLYLYSCFLFFVFAAEIGAGAAGYKYRNKIKVGFKNGIESALADYHPGESGKSHTIDDMQIMFHCCGVTTFEDWFTTEWSIENGQGEIIPASCCRHPDTCDAAVSTNSTEQPTDTVYYKQGCYDKVLSFMEDNLDVIGGTAIGIAFFQLIGVVLSCCLAKNINKAKYERVA